MNNSNVMLLEVLASKLRDFFPSRSEFQIRPLIRKSIKLINDGIANDLAIYNITNRYSIDDVNGFRSVLETTRNHTV